MTSPDGFDRPLGAWLEGEAAMRAPDDLLPQVLDRAARTRRRPGWATEGRWISMETRAQLGAVPRSVILLATLGLLTLLAAGAVTFAAGSGTGTSALPPTGPAGNGLMAFSSAGSERPGEAQDIWVMDPEGLDRRQLTDGPGDEHDATWSRDGTRLAYWSVAESGSPSSLAVLALDGSDPVTVFTDDAGRVPAGVDWSPDGTRIAFAMCPDVMCGEFHVVAADGTGSTSVGGPEFEAHALAWSPDGTTLAFGGRHAGDLVGVYLMALDGSDIRRISPADRLAGFVAVEWSADGEHLLTHAGTDSSGSDIWVFAADGSGGVNLTDGPATGFFPDWSPDGSWVAFRDGSTVYLVPGEGGETRRIGTGEGYEWSPDGTLLAISGPAIDIVDVLTGDTIAAFPTVPGVDSWQRVLP